MIISRLEKSINSFNYFRKEENIMNNQELIKQSNLIITSLVERLNNSEDFMKTLNWKITFDEVESFCSYYGALPTEVSLTSLSSFHKKMQDYYRNSKSCTTRIYPYFTGNGEIISKFEETTSCINNGKSEALDTRLTLYSEVVEDLKNARNLSPVVFIYEVFLPLDLEITTELFKRKILEVKKALEKVLSNNSQIENAKKTLLFNSLNKQNHEFTESLRHQYKTTEILEV